MPQIYLPTGKNYSERATITSIVVDPSAANWVCVLEDDTGKIIFTARGADATARSYKVNINSEAFNMTTATNITAVMLYG